MQTCSKCNAQSPDAASHCIHCGADLSQFSTTVVTRLRFQQNPRVKMVRLLVMPDSCPACQEMAAAYAKEAMPALPVEGCSHPLGCRCFYQPYLEEIYP